MCLFLNAKNYKHFSLTELFIMLDNNFIHLTRCLYKYSIYVMYNMYLICLYSRKIASVGKYCIIFLSNIDFDYIAAAWHKEIIFRELCKADVVLIAYLCIIVHFCSHFHFY